MDLFKELVRINNENELINKAAEIYETESDDEEDDHEFIDSLRRDLINNYLKVNHRQFALSRSTLKKYN